VDGKPVERTELVAPGFVAARVPPGRHRVAATVSALPGTSVFIGLGALVVAVASLVRRTHLERAVAFAGRLRAKPPGAIL
jgi:hypothetical protein